VAVARKVHAPEFPIIAKACLEINGVWLAGGGAVGQVYRECLAGKHRRAMFPRQAEYHAGEPLVLVHGAVGPVWADRTGETPSGSQYFILLVDECSRFMWLCTLHSKDQATDAIKQFQFMVEAETGHKLKAFRTERGEEFTSVEFMEHCI
jgi:hypothetical protein